MKDRWRVQHGYYQSWRVYQDEALIAVFSTWRRAYEYAREQAIYQNLSIVRLEICS